MNSLRKHIKIKTLDLKMLVQAAQREKTHVKLVNRYNITAYMSLIGSTASSKLFDYYIMNPGKSQDFT